MVWFALQHVEALRLELSRVELDPLYLCLILVSVGSIFLGQAGVTTTIVTACDKNIQLSQAIYLNNLAGFWGLVMPFGSVGYKAQQLKGVYQVSLKQYGGMFIISLISSLWVSSILLMIGLLSVEKNELLYSALVLSFLGIVAGTLYPFWKFVLNKFFQELKEATVKLNWWKLSAWHAFGLFNYVVLYLFCFKALGIDIHPLYLAAWVAIQSFVFLAPIVPGNLVVMETLGAMFLSGAGYRPESIVLGIALMRLGCLVGLLLLSPVSFFRKRNL